MHQRQYPQLSRQVEYPAAGVAADVAGDAPDCAGSKACYLYVVTAVAPNNSLELTFANGATRALTVRHGQEIRADFIAVTANTTCGPVQVGWE